MNPGCLTLENHSQTVLTAGMPGFIFFYVPVTSTDIQVANSASRSGHYLKKKISFSPCSHKYKYVYKRANVLSCAFDTENAEQQAMMVSLKGT